MATKTTRTTMLTDKNFEKVCSEFTALSNAVVHQALPLPPGEEILRAFVGDADFVSLKRAAELSNARCSGTLSYRKPGTPIGNARISLMFLRLKSIIPVPQVYERWIGDVSSQKGYFETWETLYEIADQLAQMTYESRVVLDVLGFLQTKVPSPKAAAWLFPEIAILFKNANLSETIMKQATAGGVPPYQHIPAITPEMREMFKIAARRVATNELLPKTGLAGTSVDVQIVGYDFSKVS